MRIVWPIHLSSENCELYSLESCASPQLIVETAVDGAISIFRPDYKYKNCFAFQYSSFFAHVGKYNQKAARVWDSIITVSYYWFLVITNVPVYMTYVSVSQSII